MTILKSTITLSLLLLALTALACTGPAPLPIATEPGQVTMSGDYIWIQEPDDKGPFKAIFTPTKKGEYQVQFYMILAGENRVFSGTAVGNLVNGSLNGEVQNEVKNSTYRFRGTSSDGTFTGSHVEIIKDGKEDPTGTIMMKIVNE